MEKYENSVPSGSLIRVILHRFAAIIPLVWIVATLTFIVVHAAPGSYADQIDHPRLTEEARSQIRHRYGLDQPLHVQYGKWLFNVARADFGSSFHYKRPVTELIADALPPTMMLAATALFIDLFLGIVLAVAAVAKPDGWFDRLCTVTSLMFYGMPSFWLAGMLIFIFSLYFGWLPPSHMHDVGAAELSVFASAVDLLRHLILPATCLGVLGAATTQRYLRAAMLDVRDSRYILAARARGISERRIRWVHMLRPALLPVITLLGLSLPFFISGSVVIETIFSWPGMGRLLIGAAHARDIPVIMAITVVGAVAVMLGNLIADVLYAVVDPRARADR